MAMMMHMPYSTSRVAAAKSARMNCGIAVMLPLPPCSWAILAAWAEAAGPGRPWPVREAVMAVRNRVIKLDPAGNVVFATYFGGNGNVTVIPRFIRADFASATRDVLYGMCIIMAVAAVIALRGLRRGVQEDTTADQAALADQDPGAGLDPARR